MLAVFSTIDAAASPTGRIRIADLVRAYKSYLQITHRLFDAIDGQQLAVADRMNATEVAQSYASGPKFVVPAGNSERSGLDAQNLKHDSAGAFPDHLETLADRTDRAIIGKALLTEVPPQVAWAQSPDHHPALPVKVVNCVRHQVVQVHFNSKARR